MYNAGLKNGSFSRKYIDLSTTNNSEHGPKVDARELMATAISSYGKLNRKRSPVATTLIQIYKNLLQYSKAIDVFVQYDPTIAVLVWGSIRVLLQVWLSGVTRKKPLLMFQIGEEEERASRIAGEGIIEILRHVGRWEQISALSDILNSVRLQEALVALYVRVLDFLVSSTRWLKRSALGKSSIYRGRAYFENFS